jgi:hypothetical protein
VLPADGDRADANGLPATPQAWVDVTEVTSEALAISEPARMSERDVAAGRLMPRQAKRPVALSRIQASHDPRATVDIGQSGAADF